MVKHTNNIKSDVQDLKIIPMCDLFYKVALDTARLLLKTDGGKKVHFGYY
jgi:hypothetical protein